MKFNQVLEGLKIREQRGIIPPKFVIERVLDEMKGFVNTGVEKNVLFTNLYPLAHFVYTSIEFKDRSDENL